MRNDFVGYYSLTEQDYKRLWTEGLIVLDTNVLLDLYRLPASARDELIAVLESFKSRLWVPYQVALEYQRRRLTVIASERKATEDTLAGATTLFDNVKEKVEKLQIERRGLGIDVAPLLEELKGIGDKLVTAIDAAHVAQLDIAITDPIRDKLDELLSKRVGQPPVDQGELEKLIEGGDQRYENSIPPGYADLDKEKNPKEATFYHDDICYQRKFGDLILWRQVIHHVRANAIKHVLLVTSDRKEDWWWREKGKTIGPRPELCREIAKQGAVETFWMYSSAQFLETSKSYTKVPVTDNSVNELREVANTKMRDITRRSLELSAEKLLDVSHMLRPTRSVSHAIEKWLLENFEYVAETNATPQFRAIEKGLSIGFDYLNIGTVGRLVRNSKISQTIYSGQLAVRDGICSTFGLIILISSDEILDISPSDLDYVRLQVMRLSEENGGLEIVLGYINDNNTFTPIFHKKR